MTPWSERKPLYDHVAMLDIEGQHLTTNEVLGVVNDLTQHNADDWTRHPAVLWTSRPDQHSTSIGDVGVLKGRTVKTVYKTGFGEWRRIDVPATAMPPVSPSTLQDRPTAACRNCAFREDRRAG